MHAGALLPAQYHSGGLPMGFQSTSPTPMTSRGIPCFYLISKTTGTTAKTIFLQKNKGVGIAWGC